MRRSILEFPVLNCSLQRIHRMYRILKGSEHLHWIHQMMGLHSSFLQAFWTTNYIGRYLLCLCLTSQLSHRHQWLILNRSTLVARKELATALDESPSDPMASAPSSSPTSGVWGFGNPNFVSRAACFGVELVGAVSAIPPSSPMK